MSLVETTSGMGFTVIKKLSERPIQPFRDGVTIMVEEIVVFVLFRA